MDSIPAFVRKLMPDATEEQLLEATSVFADYITVAWRIFSEHREEKKGEREPDALSPDDRADEPT